MGESGDATRLRGHKWRGDDRMARVYGVWSPVYDFIFGKALQKGREEALRILAPRAGERVLEIGVGTGLTFDLYPAGATVVGIDISGNMISKARERAPRFPDLRVRLHVMDASRLAFPDETFDAVLAAYVLTAVENPATVCAEIRRVLKPGGRVITVSNSNARRNLVEKARGALSPIFWRIGFSTNLDVPFLLQLTGMEITRERIIEPFHRVVEAVRR